MHGSESVITVAGLTAFLLPRWRRRRGAAAPSPSQAHFRASGSPRSEGDRSGGRVPALQFLQCHSPACPGDPCSLCAGEACRSCIRARTAMPGAAMRRQSFQRRFAMPDRQVDLSRLEGNALARWYRRSPQEIEQERLGARNQAYDAFFTPTRLGQVDRPAAANSSAPNGVADCIGCHGRIPPPFSFPFPIDGFPIFREGSSRPPSKPPGRDRKQCDLQYASDTDICVGQIDEKSKAVCHESAADRLAHCLRYGEVDIPALKTFPGGRRKWR